MKTGRRVKNRIDNRGISLVELIVVISIMPVMIGILSLGIGLMFSRDANYVAVRIDDALTEARTLPMSKEGTFSCVIHIDPSDSGKNTKHKVRIYQSIKDDSDNYNTTLIKEMALDKSTSIEVTGGTGLPASGDVAFVFSKSKGSVTKVGAGGGESEVNSTVTSGAAADGVYEITVTSTRGSSKVKKVTLVATTGRHYTDK